MTAPRPWPSILPMRPRARKLRIVRGCSPDDPRLANLAHGWRRNRKYTLDEECFILSHLTSWRRETIARHLGRTVRQIRDWCWRTGQNPRNQELLTSGQAARELGCSCQWLTQLAREGRIKARREPGGRWWLFDPRDLAGLDIATPARRQARREAAQSRWRRNHATA
jgi:hypothetical protein